MADEMLRQIDQICDHLDAVLESTAELADAKLNTVAAEALAAALSRRTIVAGMPVPTIFEIAMGVDPVDVRTRSAQARADTRRTVARLVRVCDAVGEETAAIALNSALIALGGAGLAPLRPA